MSENREVTLADFQACSGIDDVGEAIEHLERNNWDLLAALNTVMHHDTQQLPSETNAGIEMVEVIEGVSVIKYSSQSINHKLQNSVVPQPCSSDNIKPGTSTIHHLPTPRILSFFIYYLDQTYKIDISELCTISDLKDTISDRTNVGSCQQKLYGWHQEPANNSIILKSLNLPQENKLNLCKNSEHGDSSSERVCLSDRLTRTYTLNIYDETNSKSYKLQFSGTHTILEVKTGIYSLIDIPVRNQKWSGWPSTVKDDRIILAQSGISFPEHDLSVSQILSKDKKEKNFVVESDSSGNEIDDTEDFEDAQESFIIEDDIFIDPVQSTKLQHLMPDNVEDETVGTLHFSEQFEKRYGPVHPEFFTGTFDEAVRESCLKPPREVAYQKYLQLRKLLAVYLHHDNSVLTNVFCTQLLGCETVLQLFSANFIIWGWDLTFESNKQKFLSSAVHSLGLVGSETIRNIDIDILPVLIIFMRSKSTTEIFTVVHGNIGVNELLTNLIHSVDVFQEQKRVDMDAEEERKARERVKQEQDRAYQESLAADRAKEEAKLVQQELERQQKEQAENDRLAKEAKKEAHRQAVELNLPPEPDTESRNNILKVKVRLPGGKFLERRFYSDTPLEILLNFLTVEGYPTEEYKVLSSWPRRDLTSMDTKLTLTELKFCPQETVIVEEK